MEVKTPSYAINKGDETDFPSHGSEDGSPKSRNIAILSTPCQHGHRGGSNKNSITLHISALADASVQTAPDTLPSMKPQQQSVQLQQERLQSAMHAGAADGFLFSQNNSPIPSDLGGRGPGNCPINFSF